ncbi:hypothetical protein LJB99_04640 [Deltaproteobacteria bacterium OttesenSCG-928-K17]|nr:hypothetical protein [Deltaproteobacteria bacterium OttesenSCG-928-K17]
MIDDDPNAERYNKLTNWDKVVSYSKAEHASELIRYGDYSGLQGVKEILYYDKEPHGFYQWNLMYYLGPRLVEITVYAEPDIDNLAVFWAPIIDSMEFNAEIINKITIGEPEKINWSKKSPKARQFKYSFVPEFFIAGLYDSTVNLFPIEGDEKAGAPQTKDDYTEIGDFSDELDKHHFVKYDKRLILKPLRSAPEIQAVFYLEAKEPSEKGWSYIFEGLIEVGSGKLLVNEGVGVVVEIKLTPGVYKFRVYFKEKDENEYWHIYFWSTDEKETNDVKIIKN